ncbi:hypothetical protein LTR95_011753 [Oleoguttula sp. CCFEE 5521]
MVFLKWPCRPEDVEMTLAASISTEPMELSISDLKREARTLQPVITINIRLRCVSSTEPDRPLTADIHDTAFDSTNTCLDVLAQGRLGWLVATNANDAEGSPKSLCLGMLKVHLRHIEEDANEDLRKWPRTVFLTVPSLNSRDDVVVSFPITAQRLFEHSYNQTPDYFKPGEKYTLSLLEGYLSAWWWCWGGPEDLKDQKLNIYSKREQSSVWQRREPTEEEIEREKWVIGEDISHLQFVYTPPSNARQASRMKLAMVLVKRQCAPEDEEARVAVSLTIEPCTVSIAAMKSLESQPVFTIQIRLRCIKSVRPDDAITIEMDGTVFDNTETGLDSLAQGRIGPLVLSNRREGDPPKGLSFGILRVRHRYIETSDTVDLRCWPDTAFLTIPAMSEQRDAVVSYPITTERLFEHADGKGPDYFRAGERYRLSLHEGYVGALWWCWGDFLDDLKDKKLNLFQKGGHTNICPPREPSIEEMDREKWILGEDIAHLQFDCEGGRSCELSIVE